MICSVSADLVTFTAGRVVTQRQLLAGAWGPNHVEHAHYLRVYMAGLRRKLTDDILKCRFHILELERHRARVRKHLDRLGRRPETDVLGSMLRARAQSITDAIKASEVQIGAIERAYSMLEGYSYEMEPLPVEVEAEDLPMAAE